MIQFINKKILDETSAKAKQNIRLRMNYNIHTDLNDPINRLLNAMEPGTYVRPHRHANPAKCEAIIVLRGSLDILIFDEVGNIVQRETLSLESGNYSVDIPAGVWHGLVVNVPDTVVYEVKTGPFMLLDERDLAPWSPAVEDLEKVEAYIHGSLRSTCG